MGAQLAGSSLAVAHVTVYISSTQSRNWLTVSMQLLGGNSEPAVLQSSVAAYPKVMVSPSHVSVFCGCESLMSSQSATASSAVREANCLEPSTPESSLPHALARADRTKSRDDLCMRPTMPVTTVLCKRKPPGAHLVRNGAWRTCADGAADLSVAVVVRVAEMLGSGDGS